MKEITAIIKTGNEDLYNIFLDNEFFMTCNIEIVKQLKLKVGRLIDEAGLNELVEESNIKKAFNDALHYLSYQRRTKSEVQSHLKGFEESVVERAIEKLLEYSLIDDEGYGKDFVISRGNQLKGRHLIERNLITKGLEKEIIKTSLKELSEEDELRNAEKLAYDFFISKQSLPMNQIKQKLSQKLMAKGYSWDIIKKAIEFLEGNEEVQEIITQQEAIYFQQAMATAEKLFTKYSKKEANKYQLSSKIKASLYQKGFEENCIRRVVEALF